MHQPPVLLENSTAVYEHYLRHRQNRMRALATHAVMGYRFRPRVTFDEGAREQLQQLLRGKQPAIFALNHLSQNDPHAVAAMAWCSPLRPLIGRVRMLAKDELFDDPEQRRKIDMMGGIPVFRGKDHGIRAVNAAGQQMMDVCARRLTRGDYLALFPEGTCNTVDPARVQAVGSGIGHIAFRAAKLGAPPALVCIGISYGERLDPSIEPTKEEVRSASFYFRRPVLELPSRPIEIARFVRTELQSAVDGAVKSY
ncbi:lysophospholipid acyltransferase family protein [Nocardia sp. bgisy134]|uniref:lysophospholipid acyltransferase family protein n=1 Tax=Nocardia sp. bgisy134 TaxID=3413789 RepID=UPI003D758EE1